METIAITITCDGETDVTLPVDGELFEVMRACTRALWERDFHAPNTDVDELCSVFVDFTGSEHPGGHRTWGWAIPAATRARSYRELVNVVREAIAEAIA